MARWLEADDAEVSRAFAECRKPELLVRAATELSVERRLVVATASECVALALRRTRNRDARLARALDCAQRWTRGAGSPADAWASAFAASHAAEELGEEAPYAAEAALACAACAFACDPRADDSYYAQRGYAASAVEHAIRAWGMARHEGQRLCLDAVRQRITLGVLRSAIRRATQPPAAPAA